MHDCIIFAGYKDSCGYGVRKVGGVNHGAHRVAYCEANGVTLESIKGLIVRHTCDNPSCVNPAHLVIGTQADNMADKVERGRARGQASGADNTRSKLTAQQVEAIRREYVPRSKEHGLQALANKYGVSAMQIHRIVKSLNW